MKSSLVKKPRLYYSLTNLIYTAQFFKKVRILLEQTHISTSA